MESNFDMFNLRQRYKRHDKHQLTLVHFQIWLAHTRGWKKNAAKTPLKTQNLGLALKSKIVPHAKI